MKYKWICCFAYFFGLIAVIATAQDVSACTINITSPTTGAGYAPPASVNIAGYHDCPDFNIYLYDGGSQFATIPASGDGLRRTYFNYTWNNVTSGSHTLTAHIGGAVNVTSQPVSFHVRQLREATFISQAVPTTMVAGRQYAVNVKMRNDGSATWVLADGYKLGSQNPGDNTTWGFNRVAVPGSVVMGQVADINFTVAAPAAGGTYNFQWRMLDEGDAWFGQQTPNVSINVVAGAIAASPARCTIPSGTTTCSTSISWSSNASGAQVFVTGLDGSNSQLFAAGQSGTQVASWISTAGARFHLKVGTETLSTVDVSANPAPVISLTAPSAGAVYVAPASVTLTANASDNGSVSKVEFYNGNTKIGEDISSPYAFTWSSVAASATQYVIKARVFDNLGAYTDSATRSITVHTLPTIALTAPANGAIAEPNGSILIKANANDDNGISSVEFFVDGVSMNVDSSAPYEYTWSNASTGAHSVHAIARDVLGGSTTSMSASMTVSKVIGSIGGLVETPSGHVLRGWACSMGLNQSIGVHLYMGGAAGSGTFAGSFSANLASEPGISSACSTQGAAYRFEIPITTAMRRGHPGKFLYVHGISPIGGSNYLITGSGAYAVPADISQTAARTYDELGRVISIKGNNGQHIQYRYDNNGNLIKTIDSTGVERTFEYDALNRRTKSVGPEGVARYQYGPGNRVSQVVDPRNNTTTYLYDGFGDLWSRSSPDTGVMTYLVDVYGHPISAAHSDGSQATYAHDALGRVTTIVSGTSTHTYTYDSCTNGKGRICKVQDETGSVSYGYTPEGLLTTQMSVLPSNVSATIAYAHDGIGRVTGITYPDGTSVGYAYSHGKPASMTVTIAGATTTVVSGISYSPFEGIDRWLYGNGLNRSYNRDRDGRLTGVSTGTPTGVWQSLTYGYDTLDRISAITNGVNTNLSHEFGYDSASRLTSAITTGLAQSFTYDGNGNRESHSQNGVTDTYQISQTSNRLLGVSGSGPAIFSSDQKGNLLSDGVATYTYDSFNRLASASTGTMSATYAVNGIGQRVKKDVNGQKSWYAYNSASDLVAEYSQTQLWTNYLYFDGQIVGFVRSGAINYVHTDHLGRPEIVTNSGKAVVWRANNNAFDRMVTHDAIGGLNIGFPGQYLDQETGLWYNINRYYNSRIGRYTQSDPIGLQGGLNTYSYVSADPVNLIDPLGLEGVGHWNNGSMDNVANGVSANECEAEAAADLVVDLIPVGAQAAYVMDTLGVDFNIYDQEKPIELGDYDVATPYAAAGHTLNQMADRYEGKARRQYARATSRNVHYSVNNGRANRAAANMTRASLLRRVTRFLGPLGAFMNHRSNFMKCQCKSK